METLLGSIYYGEIILPDDIHIATGRECNLWWSTVAVYEEGDRSVYFEVKCDIGLNTARGFVVTPTEEQIGDHKLVIRSRDLHTRRILSEKAATLHVVSEYAGEGERNILMIGDSRTWHSANGRQGYDRREQGNKTTTGEVELLLNSRHGAEFKFVGTTVSPIDPAVRNLADNGWQYATAIEAIEAAGGAKAYIENECGLGAGASLDYMTVMYGINDLSDWHQNNLDQYERSCAKIDTIVANAKKLCRMFEEAYPEIKIAVVLECSTAGNQDGYGYWGATDNDSQVEMEFAVKALRKKVIEQFDCGRFSPNVYVSSAGLWCDRIYGYPYLDAPVSDRTPDERVLRLINCVHPHDNGYKQIADGDFSTIKYLESIR